MGKAGGDRCAMEVYHQWFHDGSPLYDGAKSLSHKGRQAATGLG
jgi:hypothetical protein